MPADFPSSPSPKPETTHRCKVCGAHWRLNWPTKVQPGGSWSLVYPSIAGKCCDNVAMADQIEALGEPLRCAHCREEIRPEGEGWMDAETCMSCEDTGAPHTPMSAPKPETPKPEMLEKAEAVVRAYEAKVPRFTIWAGPSRDEVLVPAVALALEEVVRSRDHEWCVNLMPTSIELLDRAEALRASEASVESLRKERDDARHIVKLLEQSVDNVIRQREAAHAEATKAEKIRLADILIVAIQDGLPAVRRAYDIHFHVASHHRLATIRAPRQPEPTSPHPDTPCNCFSSPTPPSEEPRE